RRRTRSAGGLAAPRGHGAVSGRAGAAFTLDRGRRARRRGRLAKLEPVPRPAPARGARARRKPHRAHLQGVGAMRTDGLNPLTFPTFVALVPGSGAATLLAVFSPLRTR